MTYYRVINEQINLKLGGQNSAKLIMISLNFAEIEELQHSNKWKEATDILIQACRSLQSGGADFIVICTNTMHKLLPQIEKEINLEFLHIAKATADEISAQNIKKVGLLGTKFTMNEDFYKQILIDEGIEVVVPSTKDMQTIHNIIYKELCLGKIKTSSKKIYLNIVNRMGSIDGVILGCTEIGMLVKQSDLSIKVFDTTLIHAKKSAQYALLA